MKTTINKLFILIIATTLITLVTACDSSTLRQSQEESNAEVFILNGTISLNADAMPKEFINKNTTANRAATSSFKPTNDDYSYYVIAVQGQKTLNATISKSDDSVYYTLYLNSRGTWIIKAFLYYELELVAQAEDEEVIISEGIANGSSVSGSKWLSVTPLIDSSKKGAINLAVKNQVAATSSITWHWVDVAKTGNSKLQDQTKTVSSSNQIAEFSYESVNSGSYNVEIIFKDSTGKLLYSCYEAINVFANWTTDTWCGKSPYLNDKNEFVFDDTVSDAYAKDTKRLDIDENTTLYYLWSNVPAEANTLDENPAEPLQTQYGGQIFTSLSSNTTITSPIADSSNFCFDGSTLYIPPYRYINSYAGYSKDESFDLYNILETPENIQVEIPSDTSSVFLDGRLYFLFATGDLVAEDYYVGCYDTINKTFMRTYFTIYSASDPTERTCPAFTVTHTKDPDTQEVTGGVIYYALENKNTQNEDFVNIIRRPFEIKTETMDYQGQEITYTSLSFIDTIENGSNQMNRANYNLQSFINSTDMLWYQLYRNLRVSDMTVIGNNLYVLVYYALFPEMTYGEYYKTGDSDPEKLCDSFISTGGILKFDTSSNAYAADRFVPQAWPNYSGSPGTENRILGFYSEIGCVNEDGDPFSYADGQDSSDSTVFPVQPPLAQKDSYFYGPRKILATAENKIIIADDGGFIQIDSTGKGNRLLDKRKPINRVLTVNLSDYSFENIIEVGTTFSAAYSSGYGANCFSPDIIMVGP